MATFDVGVSGNPLGRPKGSRNKITLLKLMAEEAVLLDNSAAMLAVCKQIIEQAEDGHKASQRLVWDTVMSKGIQESQSAKEKVEINIGTFAAPEKPIEGEIIEEQKDDES